MISYDILQNLENNCFELLNATTGMISGSNEKSMGKSHQNIVRALRKIVIANEMMGKGIICISGLQGAGKSTLMKNFYGLSDEYFNIKTGVGEKIPVFICENGECKGPEMYAMTLEKQDAGTYIRKNVKMNAEDFRNASSGEETNLNIMYLELRVPYKHLNNESYAFMLLPGFEKKNDYWRSLIDFSVKCSDTSIFVFNESSFSKYDNQVLLDKIHERFGESLIYAISQSDLSEDNNANNPAETMKVIAELGAEHFGLATLNKSSEENSSLIIPETINEKLQVGYKEIAEKVTNVDKVVLGTLGITGVDILADGVLDAIPTIAAGLGISVPIVAATAGLIMAGTSSVAIVQDINRLKRTELSSAQNAIIAIQSQIKTKYLESYDEAMQAIRDRIEENLIAATGVNKQIFKKTSAMIAISKIDNDLDIICREVTRKAYDIGEVFR